MATESFRLDPEIADDFRAAVKERYGCLYGHLGKEAEIALKERTEQLRSQERPSAEVDTTE